MTSIPSRGFPVSLSCWGNSHLHRGLGHWFWGRGYSHKLSSPWFPGGTPYSCPASICVMGHGPEWCPDKTLEILLWDVGMGVHLIYSSDEEMVIDWYLGKGISEGGIFLLKGKQWEVSSLNSLFIRPRKNGLWGIHTELVKVKKRS